MQLIYNKFDGKKQVFKCRTLLEMWQLAALVLKEKQRAAKLHSTKGAIAAGADVLIGATKDTAKTLCQ